MDPLIQAGTPAPTFSLADLSGREISLRDFRGQVIVLNFWSAECDWCERVDRELTASSEAWKDQVQVWWIASNAHESPSFIRRVAGERKLPMVLLDPQQKVANMYGAQTTPHFFVVDQEGKLAYQGAWDDVTFRQRQATQTYLPAVVQALIDHQVPQVDQTPPYGCVLVRSFTETG